MPRVNAENSFESAATHLLRHINDEGMLRDNPLVREELAQARAVHANALARVHSRLLAETESICRQLYSLGQSQHA